MEEMSEITIKDIWPYLKEMGIVELRIDNRTIWSDFALDPLADKDYYSKACNDYLKCVEEYLDDWYANFRVIAIDIKIVDFHHCVANIEGYFENIEEEIEE